MYHSLGNVEASLRRFHSRKSRNPAIKLENSTPIGINRLSIRSITLTHLQNIKKPENSNRIGLKQENNTILGENSNYLLEMMDFLMVITSGKFIAFEKVKKQIMEDDL